MTGNTPFDNLAEQYDSLFTRSLTGMAQRTIVWRYLKPRIFRSIEILDVGCGTGEDARYLSGHGCRVTATDASAAMIRKCLGKNLSLSGSGDAVFRQSSVAELDAVIAGREFDLIFSNFSVLNCLDPAGLQEAAAKFYSFLKPEGKMIFVLFGTRCLWERIYFLMKGRRKEMNRRESGKHVFAGVLNLGMQIHYYSPGELRKIFGNLFVAIKIKPVGFFLPPSYMEKFFIRRKIFLGILEFTERLCGSFSFLSDFADHYIIEFRKA
jgi:ubiquinone/menaquinone biosynthesis C-methylase UbiE